MLAVKIMLVAAILSGQLSFAVTSSPDGSTPLRRQVLYGLLGFLLPVIGLVITLASPASVFRKR